MLDPVAYQAETDALGVRLRSQLAAEMAATLSSQLAAELAATRAAINAELEALRLTNIVTLRGHADRAIASNGHLGCQLGRFLRPDTHSPLCRAVFECARLWRLQANLLEVGLQAEPDLYEAVTAVVSRTGELKSSYEAALAAGPRAVRRWTRS